MTSHLRQSTSVSGPSEHPMQWALQRTDYLWARGQIDVVEDGDTVRSCRFVHEPPAARLEVYCSIEAVTYQGHSDRGWLTYQDGRELPATSARSARDIPNWLLCPTLAPIWGRSGDDWLLDTSDPTWIDQCRTRLSLLALRPEQADGYADVVWPQAYLSTLALGSEHYMLRDLEWRPTLKQGQPQSRSVTR